MLAPGGTLRVSTPDLAKYALSYARVAEAAAEGAPGSKVDGIRDRAAAARAYESSRVAAHQSEGFSWAMQKPGPVFQRWPERVKATRVKSR